MTTRTVLASNNAGKAREIGALLAPHGIELLAQSGFGVPEAEETGLTFVENALIKARNACACTGLPALADDSGIEVDGLDGAPGIHSARFAGPGADDAANNRRLIEALSGIADAGWTARYQCLIVYLRHEHDPTPVICQGTWAGRITVTARGSNGFGYDPHFLVPELGVTAAELDPDTKNRISHRGQALAALTERLRRVTG